jgi:hypothetical protein
VVGLVVRGGRSEQGSKQVRVARAPARGRSRTRSTRACSWGYGWNGRGCPQVRVLSCPWAVPKTLTRCHLYPSKRVLIFFVVLNTRRDTLLWL